MKVVTPALTSLLICACASSPPIRYYVLDPVGPARDGSAAPEAPLQIASVHLPPALDRREIVREDTANRLTVSGPNRWGAPLPDMTQRVLSQNLMLRLAPGKVVLPGQPAPAGANAISVDIVQFGADANGMIVLEGSWAIVPGGNEVAAASHRFQLGQRAVGSDYVEQAHIMSLLLGQLADEIASKVAQHGGH